jgi:hypothetical protein
LSPPTRPLHWLTPRHNQHFVESNPSQKNGLRLTLDAGWQYRSAHQIYGAIFIPANSVVRDDNANQSTAKFA